MVVVKGLTPEKIVEMDWWMRKAIDPNLKNYEIDYSSIRVIEEKKDVEEGGEKDEEQGTSEIQEIETQGT